MTAFTLYACSFVASQIAFKSCIERENWLPSNDVVIFVTARELEITLLWTMNWITTYVLLGLHSNRSKIARTRHALIRVVRALSLVLTISLSTMVKYYEMPLRTEKNTARSFNGCGASATSMPIPIPTRRGLLDTLGMANSTFPRSQRRGSIKLKPHRWVGNNNESL